MPIQVICPGCLSRFKVSDKFAGKEGPCPKCKATMKIPLANEEVVIHAPEDFGPKDAGGRPVLKPIERQETKLTPVQIVAIVSVVIAIPVVAFVVGRVFGADAIPKVVLGLGAFLVAPPIVWSGYSFLRNDELEPYRGTPLAVRVGICSVVFALMWGAYDLLGYFWLGGAKPEIWQLVFMIPILFVPGTLSSLATLDLDGTNAAIHFGYYFGVTVILRLIMGMSAL